MRNSRLVYSTETGRHCPKCSQPANQCVCKKGRPGGASKATPDGVIRIRREVKGRKGKSITTLAGFDPDQTELKQMAAKLKRICGSGGSVKDGVIIIQGDQRTVLQAELIKAGFRVKSAGG